MNAEPAISPPPVAPARRPPITGSPEARDLPLAEAVFAHSGRRVDLRRHCHPCVAGCPVAEAMDYD